MPKHNIKEVIRFGEQLLETNDLDPVYVALVHAQLPEAQLKRLLLAYFCFYHLGASAYISEYDSVEFWEVMEQAADNQMPPSGTDSEIPHDRWPRGAERRHFRGDKCVAAVKKLASFDLFGSGTLAEDCPDYLIDTLCDGYDGKLPIKLASVMARVQDWPLFGPWIAFKVADVLNRVLEVDIEFPTDLTLIYKEPRAALDMLNVPAETANKQLLDYFSDYPAPPRLERLCWVNEIETMLCKWKSHVNGHYWVGRDIHEIRKGLKGWGETADRLLANMPKEVERGLFA